jgi:hypothetical protein
VNGKTRWVLSVLHGQGGPRRDPETGRFTASEGTDVEQRPAPSAKAYDGGAARGAPVRPAGDPEAEHAALVVALARRSRGGEPFVA